MAHWDPRLPVTSSEEPAWTVEAEETYQDALEALLANHPEDGPPVPFVVGGAFAIHRHTGIWRTTKDIDFFLAPSDIPAAFERLAAAGFETAVEDPVWLAKARRGEQFVDLITGVGNASLVIDRSWIDRGLAEIVLGVPCRVLGPEECIASKCFVAFRERFDGADVVHLVKACGPRLDWHRLLYLMGEHWILLYWSLLLYAYVYPAHTDAVPETVWRELLQRFTEQLRHPDKEAPFRGSLVDPRMFAIDVDEWGERNLYQEFCDNHPCLLRVEDAVGSEE
ncbi:MAG TPA: nucleotidyl transferase AbiEii/AbiGii toxin family protein [Terracidiphilus sp.]